MNRKLLWTCCAVLGLLGVAICAVAVRHQATGKDAPESKGLLARSTTVSAAGAPAPDSVCRDGEKNDEASRAGLQPAARETANADGTGGETPLAIGELTDEVLRQTKAATNPAAMVVHGYIKDDRALLDSLGQADFPALFEARYNLVSDLGVELATTDLMEMFACLDVPYYQNAYGSEKLLAYIDRALDLVLARDPANFSAVLLKAKVELNKGDPEAAVRLVLGASGNIGDQRMCFPELVNTAKHLIDSGRLSARGVAAVQEAVFNSGVDRKSPLGQFLTGQANVVNLYRPPAKASPFDMGTAKRFFQDNHLGLPDTSQPGGDRNFQVTMMVLERDVRGLINLLGQPDAEVGRPEGLRAVANAFGGRFSVAASQLETFLKRDPSTRPEGSDCICQYLLGVMYYETGDYRRASQLFNQCESRMPKGWPSHLEEMMEECRRLSAS
jgi:hypothetical protein